MRKSLYILLLYLTVTKLVSQNLVPNYSFEEHSSCPTTLGGVSIGIANNWGGFDSSDYFSVCATNPECSVPFNLFGYQYGYTDTSFAGILLYVPTTNPVSSEFIQIQLADSLRKSHYYCVSFYVSLADSSNYAIASLGAYFSKQLLTLSEIEDNNFIPQIENSVDSMLNDKVNWKKISGYYYADGGEIFLTIGNFYNNANTVSLYIGGASFMFNSAYYYIDDVSVVQCDSLFTSISNIGLSKVIKPIRLYPSPNDGNMVLEYQLSENEKGLLIIYDITGKAIRSYNFTNSTSKIAIDASMLNSGVYLYDVYINDNKVKTDKVIIAK